MLDKLRGINDSDFRNNNNNNGGGGGTNLNLQNYGLDQPPLSLPTIEDFIENGAPPPPPLPQGGGGQNISFNNNVPRPLTRNNFDGLSSRPFVLPNIDNNGKIGNGFDRCNGRTTSCTSRKTKARD